MKKILLLSSLLFLELSAQDLARILYNYGILNKDIKNDTSTTILINNSKGQIDVYLKTDNLNELNNLNPIILKKEKSSEIEYIEPEAKNELELKLKKEEEIKKQKEIEEQNKKEQEKIDQEKKKEEERIKNLKFTSIIDSKTIIKNIKDYIESSYRTHFIKTLFYSDLDKLEYIKDSETFKEEGNKILKKYFNGEMELLYSEDINENGKLEYTLENKILTLKPNKIYDNIYSDLKNILNKNKYKYEKIILNLENNNGGSITGMTDIINAFVMFEENKNILFTLNIRGKNNYYYNDNDKNLDVLTPLEVKINNNTKLAALMCSRILSIQDRAKINGFSNNKDNTIRSVKILNDNTKLSIKIAIGEFVLGKKENQISKKNIKYNQPKTVIKVNSSNINPENQ